VKACKAAVAEKANGPKQSVVRGLTTAGKGLPPRSHECRFGRQDANSNASPDVAREIFVLDCAMKISQ
jgi:hypothetical protein